MNKYQSLTAMKTIILEKTQRKLTFNLPNYQYDSELLGDYFDDAVLIIKDWKKNFEDNIVLSGNYDDKIVKFIIESINLNGQEGQSSSSANGNKKVFINTPEGNLRSSIPQSI